MYAVERDARQRGQRPEDRGAGNEPGQHAQYEDDGEHPEGVAPAAACELAGERIGRRAKEEVGWTGDRLVGEGRLLGRTLPAEWSVGGPGNAGATLLPAGSGLFVDLLAEEGERRPRQVLRPDHGQHRAAVVFGILCLLRRHTAPPDRVQAVGGSDDGRRRGVLEDAQLLVEVRDRGDPVHTVRAPSQHSPAEDRDPHNRDDDQKDHGHQLPRPTFLGQKP